VRTDRAQQRVSRSGEQSASAGTDLAPGTPANGASRASDHTRLFGLTWAHLLNDGASNYLPGVLPAVLASLHQPVQMAGVLIATLTIGQLLQPVAGWLADRLGGRLLMVTGLVLTSVGGGLLGLAPTTWLLVVLLACIGLGNSLFHPQALAGVRSLLRGRQGLLTSVFLVGGELGRGAWPTVTSLVVATFGLRGLWIVGVPGVLTVPLLVRLAPRLPARPATSGRTRWRHRGGPVALLIGYRSVRAFTIYALATFIPIMWHARGASLVQGASVITTMLAVGVVGNLGGGQLADRVGRLPVLTVSGLASAVLIFPVAYLRGWLVWPAAGVLGIALFLSASTTVLIGQDIFPENRSLGSGLALGPANGIGAVLVLLIGLWVGRHAVVDVFWVVAVLSAASVLLGLALPAALVRNGRAASSDRRR
jgi:FSR family fosmidomycin resistance protein-like MFS transporter